MNEFGMYPSNDVSVQRWNAERENATARMELERIRACCQLIISQHDPVASLGLDRDRLAVVLNFVRHGDTARLRRDCAAIISSSASS